MWYKVIDRTVKAGVHSKSFNTIGEAHAEFMRLVAQNKECCIRTWPMFEKIEEFIPAK